MYPAIWLWLLLVTLAAGAPEEHQYCAIRYRRLCQGKGRHVACQFPDPGPGSSCERYTPIKFTNDLKHFITHYLNRRRQRIAAGNERVRGGVHLPKPQIMMLVEWDRELSQLSQRLADQCYFVHDDCRATVKFPYAGQTVGEVRWRRSSDSDELSAQRAIRRVLDAWWGERRRVQPKQLTAPFRLTAKGTVWGHFSQLAVWNLQAVGCGAVRHGAIHPRLLLVCDFSHTNMLGQRTLVPGPTAPCPIHTARRPRSAYPLLCGPVRHPAPHEREELEVEDYDDDDEEPEEGETVEDAIISNLISDDSSGEGRSSASDSVASVEDPPIYGWHRASYDEVYSLEMFPRRVRGIKEWSQIECLVLGYLISNPRQECSLVNPQGTKTLANTEVTWVEKFTESVTSGIEQKEPIREINRETEKAIEPEQESVREPSRHREESRDREEVRSRELERDSQRESIRDRGPVRHSEHRQTELNREEDRVRDKDLVMDEQARRKAIYKHEKDYNYNPLLEHTEWPTKMNLLKKQNIWRQGNDNPPAGGERDRDMEQVIPLTMPRRLTTQPYHSKMLVGYRPTNRVDSAEPRETESDSEAGSHDGRWQQTRFRPKRPGANALLLTSTSKQTKVPALSAIKLDKEDIDQLFRDTGFNMNWRKNTT